MRWASAISRESSTEGAAREAAGAALAGLDGAAPDLLVVFVSQHHSHGCEAVRAELGRAAPGAVLLGCFAGGVIGGGHEVEGEPAISVSAAHLPGARVHPFRIEPGRTPAPDAGADAWASLTGVRADDAPHFVLLSDPMSIDPTELLAGLDRHYPRSVKVGGLASGAGFNVLYGGGELHAGGLVGIALTGDVELDAVVAQGCRPVGQPLFVTDARPNALLTLDGRPALRVLGDLFASLSPADQQLCRHSLFVGLAMHDGRERYEPGDFLIRNLLGGDDSSGALVVGGDVSAHGIVQFHLRDARTSAEDLRAVLERYRTERGGATPAGALLFSCLGRGEHLYGEPDHDTGLARELLGEHPIGGFFANGEIGPVEGSTFLHGYTSSFGLFRPREP